MDKLTVVGVPLSFTSAILGCNLSLLSPVAAQENDLFLDSSPAESESFLIIDNLNSFSNSDTADIFVTTENPSFDDPINQTLAQIAQYDLQTQEDTNLGPVTKVSDLRDIKPTDWAYGALVKLINRHRCFAGYEDNTFKGDRNISRFEFAAALNSCLQKMETIAISKLSEQFTEEDLAELEKLIKEFEQELIVVQNKTDQLEDRVAFLEDHNFSTTSILRGEVAFQLVHAFGDKKAVPSGQTPTENLDSVTTFGARARLNFDTSFSGRDLFRTRIEGSNLTGYGLRTTGTQMTFLGVASNTGNNVRIGQIFYRFPIGDKGQAYIAGARQSSSAFIPVLNRASTISLFGFNNPLYDLGFGAGGGVYYQFTDLIGAGATYYAGSPNDPEPSKGFFNGDYSALGQITLTPSDNFGVSFTYAHFFTPEPRLTTNLTGFTGSLFAQSPFGLETATSSDNFNISTSYQVSDRVELGGWVGYISTVAKSSPAASGLDASTGANADIWTAALTASYNDLGKLGSKLSFVLGLPPKLTSSDVPDREDEDTSLHLELSYNYPLTEKISLTPGILTITNPEHNNENNAIIIGLMRTTLRF
ncbi:putative S-layer protein [Xenococcus sp. PCC 7305]|uniref:iron uptake porin n=1 Tax=Xenococcus sp. PCC 7305 TaxID=102125 RepID=UPI0002AC7578|nr:iron uptake porin [Xenococcus sp. PCC 7305]ELS03728.1 putative S-layer protein [Xenococcus sp. PCC 7305]